ncbi:hypothetical protein FRC09_000071 [Ceratobasidium sp. 395]|nr:hypothetical protein FRC09_000071 [Ceratobasidium sp. 395]
MLDDLATQWSRNRDVDTGLREQAIEAGPLLVQKIDTARSAYQRSAGTSPSHPGQTHAPKARIAIFSTPAPAVPCGPIRKDRVISSPTSDGVGNGATRDDATKRLSRGGWSMVVDIDPRSEPDRKRVKLSILAGSYGPLLFYGAWEYFRLLDVL